MWRNGVIVEVRNCEAPADEQAELRCAGLYCAQRVTDMMTNPQQTTLSITRHRRDADGLIDVAGVIRQHYWSPTTPTGFTCAMRHYRHADPELSFGHR